MMREAERSYISLNALATRQRWTRGPSYSATDGSGEESEIGNKDAPKVGKRRVQGFRI